ncbi:hypothetical protein [Roseomonas xinghualingensis]|uniref:hypothetical protein n=1 Tax=Roseomonas xinghualingensis TaxID=2986475 RepID=UPI0021F22990|nr:hypothetical protein [Roseomonas sp. SXEYE001]MCV4209196.1 hypothetical protein [Roseomonas sp. SXEYE001]
MPHDRDQRDEIVEAAAALAREVTGELESVLLTHYADLEALDTLRPGETDLETVQAVNTAVAAEMIEQGVEVLVQRADRAAFRRWMQGREDTPENRRGWIDRRRLLRGDAALRLLGLEQAVSPPSKPRFGKQPGPIADQLLAAFVSGDADEIDSLTQDLLSVGRDDVLNLAIRKAAERHGDQNADELAGALLSAAEVGPIGPSGWAELVALPVALLQGKPLDAASIGEGLVASGALGDALEVRFLPLWFLPETIAGLSPGALRRVLLDMGAGTQPHDLPPGDMDELARGGFGVLVGLQIDWDIPIWDDIAAEGGLPLDTHDDDAGETPEEARTTALFDRWRGSIFEASGGCVPLALVPPSEVVAEIADFLDEAGAQTRGIEEIVELVTKARHEAGEDEVVCRLEIVGEGLELSFYTEGGRFLDRLDLPAERMPVKAVEMPRLIGTFVRLVKDTPGR